MRRLKVKVQSKTQEELKAKIAASRESAAIANTERLGGELIKLNSDKELTSKKIFSLHKQQQALYNDIETLKEKKAIAEKELTNLKINYFNEHRKIEDQRDELYKSIDSIKVNTEGYKAQLNALSDLIFSGQDEIKSIDARIKASRLELSNISKLFIEAEQVHSGRVVELKKQVEELKQTLKEEESKVNSLTDNRKSIEIEYNKQKVELDSIRGELVLTKKQLHDTKEEIKNSEAIIKNNAEEYEKQIQFAAQTEIKAVKLKEYANNINSKYAYLGIKVEVDI